MLSVTTEVTLKREKAEYGPYVKFVLNALVRFEADGNATILDMQATSGDTGEVEKLDERDAKLATFAVLEAARGKAARLTRYSGGSNADQ